MSRPTLRPNADAASATAPRRRGVSVLHTTMILACFCSMAANYGSQPRIITTANGGCRSQHFIVSAPSTAFAQQVCAEAERFRRELAIEWLGHELPPWQDPCPIRVKVGRHLGAGGATSFTFINGQPRSWEMDIQGSHERILDSVLPHEVTHTIMATHFGCPLPRWADEGAATSVEDTSERTKQDKLLIEFLTTRRGIAFNHMFAMKEYPRDILPLYSQGYSLARYLIAKGGKRKFVDYLGDGMKWNNWTAATQKHYDMRSLSELQVTWLGWVRQGSPPVASDVASDIALASHEQPVGTTTMPSSQGQSPVSVTDELVPLPAPVGRGTKAQTAIYKRDTPAKTALLTSPRDGWYSRRRNEAAQQSDGSSTATAAPGTKRQVGRPQG